MKKIFCLTASLNDGASIPRINSIKHLEETGYPVQVQVDTHISDFQIEWADIVMVHRPVDAVHLQIAEAVKKSGKKLWIDNDDDQLSVPIDHSCYLQYNRDDRRHYIRESNKLADVVTISNPQILESYRGLNKNIIYYPCAYDERLVPEFDASERTKTILWRGSATHKKSIAEFADAIGKLDKDFKGWQFVFIGDYPWQMIEQIKINNWYCSPGYMQTQNLWDYSRKLKPAIQMVCLTDNQFTRSRSNMSMLDATIAGAVTVARDWTHFRTPGVCKYKDADDFYTVMAAIMGEFEDKSSQEHNVVSAWNYIHKHQTFKAINVTQMEIINDLFAD